MIENYVDTSINTELISLELLTVSEIAKITRSREQQVYKWIHAEDATARLPAIRLGGNNAQGLRIRRSDFEEWLEHSRVTGKLEVRVRQGRAGALKRHGKAQLADRKPV